MTPSRSVSTNDSVMERIEEHQFPRWPKDENTLPSVQPSIKTVELASATKIFIEHQYHGIEQPAPRTKRRMWFHREADRVAMDQDEFLKATKQYHQLETNHLRQLRVARSKTLFNKNNVRAAVADFEIIRVLGKGSFGVVRLVRKKKSGTNIVATTNRPQQLITSSIAVCPNSVARATGSTSPQGLSQLYAMKVIRKSAMLRGAQEGHLRAERDFLVLADQSRWVVPLEAAFQDNTNLYLVMDYMIGGDFLGMLLREDVLAESDAAFYLAEMILCVEESHKLGWIHRDVKPDNFLIDSRGHLKISDFGLSFDGHWSHNQGYYSKKRDDTAKACDICIRGDSQDANEEEIETCHQQHRPFKTGMPEEQSKDEPILNYMDRVNRRRYATSVVGTSQYMAPEVIRGDHYDGRCDWWSIGIILYECLYGRTPFYCESRFNTKERILRHNKHLTFPQGLRMNQPCGKQMVLPDVSRTAIDLMSRLLVERSHRLSTTKYRANDRATPYDYTRRVTRSSSTRHMMPGSVALQAGGPKFEPRSSGSANAISFVYLDDARDIKRHAFFTKWGIDFENIHDREPPHRPKIHTYDSITKYFDEENDIVSAGEAELAESSDDSEIVVPLSPSCTPSKSAKGKGRAVSLTLGCQSTPTPPERPRIQQDKKRARDKILRDPQLGKTAMALRKRRAFLGYTYRRPNIIFGGTNLENGYRPGLARSQRTRTEHNLVIGVPQGDVFAGNAVEDGCRAQVVGGHSI